MWSGEPQQHGLSRCSMQPYAPLAMIPRVFIDRLLLLLLLHCSRLHVRPASLG